MRRRGFTLIELMMVIGIISVLITISVTAINSSLKSARTQRAETLCKLVEQAVAAYYAQKDEWPVTPKDNDNNKEYYTFTSAEVREIIKKVVMETKSNNPLIDVSGLFVATSDGNKARGMDFMDAVHGSKHQRNKVTLSQMYFGYPDPESGRFKVFTMRYYPTSDVILVTAP